MKSALKHAWAKYFFWKKKPLICFKKFFREVKCSKKLLTQQLVIWGSKATSIKGGLWPQILTEQKIFPLKKKPLICFRNYFREVKPLYKMTDTAANDMRSKVLKNDIIFIPFSVVSPKLDQGVPPSPILPLVPYNHFHSWELQIDWDWPPSSWKH